MPSVSFGETHLSYDRSGTPGDPAVLVHGSWTDRAVWDRVVPALAHNLDVVRYDRRGHGSSSGPLRPHPVRDDASDLASLVEALEAFPAHLVAHGYAASVAVRLALDRPELVRSLALHDPPFLDLLGADPETRAVRRSFGELRNKVRDGQAEEAARGYFDRVAARGYGWDRVDPNARSEARRNAALWVAETWDPDALSGFRPELAGVGIPVLVTTGERSARWLQFIAERFAEELANASVVKVPLCAHVPQREDPDRYAAIVASFLLDRWVPPT